MIAFFFSQSEQQVASNSIHSSDERHRVLTQKLKYKNEMNYIRTYDGTISSPKVQPTVHGLVRDSSNH